MLRTADKTLYVRCDVTVINSVMLGVLNVPVLIDIPLSAALDTAVLPVKAIQKWWFYSADKKQTVENSVR